MEQTPCIGAAKGMQPSLAFAMSKVWPNQQGRVEKDLFCFGLADAMLVDALATIAIVPIKTGDLSPIDGLHITIIYAQRNDMQSAALKPEGEHRIIRRHIEMRRGRDQGLHMPQPRQRLADIKPLAGVALEAVQAIVAFGSKHPHDRI